MKYSWKNIQYALALAIVAAGGMTSCDDDEFDVIVAEEMPRTVYNPWYADDEKEDELELVDMPNDGWESCITVKKDKTYDRYFTRDRGMNGCDGVYTTELPDGNIFWSFGDSFFGMLSDPTLRIRGGNESNFPRNAVIIQTKQNYNGFHCLNELVQIDDKFRTDYYKGRTFLRHPKGEQTEADIKAGSIDQKYYYWPGDATVIERNGKKILQVLWGECFKMDDGGMGRDGTALTEYDLTGKPGDESYMKQISYKSLSETYITNYGSAVFECEEDGRTYLYGDAERKDGSKGPVVARTKSGYDLGGKWEYYVNKGTESDPNFVWQDDAPTRDEMRISQVMHWWGVQPNVFKHGNYYYMVSQEPLGRDVWLHRSTKPYGPFVSPVDRNKRKRVFSIPDKLDKLGDPSHGWIYNVFVHHGLSKEGELVISFNSEAPRDGGFGRNFNEVGSADFYRPYFFRIYGWENAWKDNE